MGCVGFTLKGKPCTIPPDRLDEDGKWVCHIHDKNGIFQKQKQAKREDRRKVRWRPASVPSTASQTQHPPFPSCQRTDLHPITECPLCRTG